MLLAQNIRRLAVAGWAWAKSVAPQKRQLPTRTELEAQIRAAQQVTELLQSPGWKVFEDRVTERSRANLEALAALPWTEFRAARGLQAKSEIVAARRLMNEPEQIIAEGLQAEAWLMKLAETEAKSQTARGARRV